MDHGGLERGVEFQNGSQASLPGEAEFGLGL